MQAFPSPKPSNFPPPFPHHNTTNSSKPHSNFPLPLTQTRPFKCLPILKPPSCSPKQSLDQNLLSTVSDDEDEPVLDSPEPESRSISGTAKNQSLLVVRRPVKDESSSSVSENGEEESSLSFSSSQIDLGFSKFAKKYPIFEPGRVSASSEEKPLGINLELALYRVKILARNYRFVEAEELLQQCIFIWPEDGRLYVALGRILRKQSKFTEARLVYEKGCQATQGENPYIWQCWAVLENKIGNIRRARELFDAATVADKRHVAAWHGWAVLELKQGNIKKARNLLGKGLKYCGGNEYIYQTLALLEAKGNRIEQARYLFQQATFCNPKSCASWLAWAQLEVQQENSLAARKLFEKAVQASPKNRFAWHVWAIFEASQGDIDKGRKLLKIGHALNPRDPVLLQSLALLEYKHSSANLARVLFRRASELDPRHQPVWMAWGWMEWKERNISTARELYKKALSIDSTSESAARCLQAWGVLEQRIGNLSSARRLFRSSLNINSQSYITWMTWASLEEQQGNSVRAEEIRDLYFQQRTEVVDDASWVMGFLDIIDPALDSIKRLLNLDQNPNLKGQDPLMNILKTSNNFDAKKATVSSSLAGQNVKEGEDETVKTAEDFDLDAFIRDKLSLDASKLDAQIEDFRQNGIKSSRRIWKAENKIAIASSQH